MVPFDPETLYSVILQRLFLAVELLKTPIPFITHWLETRQQRCPMVAKSQEPEETLKASENETDNGHRIAVALIELATLLAILCGAQYLLTGNLDFSDYAINPLWIPIVLMASQYGLALGVASVLAVVAVYLSGGNLWPPDAGSSPYPYLQQLSVAALWLITAVVLGLLRDRTTARIRELSRASADDRVRYTAISNFATRLKADNATLQMQVATSRDFTISSVVKTFADLRSADQNNLETMVERCVFMITGSGSYSIYLLKDERLVRVCGKGRASPFLADGHPSPAVSLLFQQENDAVTALQQQALGNDMVQTNLVAALRSPEGREVLGILMIDSDTHPVTGKIQDRDIRLLADELSAIAPQLVRLMQSGLNRVENEASAERNTVAKFRQIAAPTAAICTPEENPPAPLQIRISDFVLGIAVFYVEVLACYTLLFTNRNVALFLVIHTIVVCALYWLANARYQFLGHLTTTLLTILVAFLGPVGAAASLIFCVLLRIRLKMTSTPSNWYDTLSGRYVADPTDSLYERINSGRLHPEGQSLSPSMTDIMETGDRRQRQIALGLMLRNFHVDFLPLLKRALEDRDPLVRAQAAVVINTVLPARQHRSNKEGQPR